MGLAFHGFFCYMQKTNLTASFVRVLETTRLLKQVNNSRVLELLYLQAYSLIIEQSIFNFMITELK